MKGIQKKLMVTEKQANLIMKTIKEIREKREDYSSCIRQDLSYTSTYKKLTDAEIIIMSLKNQLNEERWNILKIVHFFEEEENEQN